MTVSVAPRSTYLLVEMKFGLWSGDVEPTTYYDPSNFTKIELTGQTQSQDKLASVMESSLGQNLASVAKPTEGAKISLEVNGYMPPALLALILGADLTELAQTTAAVADEAITAVAGLWVPLANKYLAADGTGTEIVAKTAADATVDPSHYSIDLINGMFKALDATGATVTKLSYHTATRAGEIYKAGQAKSAYFKMIGTGTEKVTQRRCSIVVHKASVAPSAAVDLAAGGYFKGTLAGDLLTPTNQSSPWEYRYLSDMAA